jgi:hypothetical protein
MENNPNIYEVFNIIFSDSPQPPKTISLGIDVLDPQNNDQITNMQLSDNFEIFLQMFIYGFKKLNLTFTHESLSVLNGYFASLEYGIKFNIEIEQFDTNLFKDPRYIKRYLIIDPASINEPEPFFIGNFNKFSRTRLNEYIAVFQYEYESMIFINFDFI